MRLPRARAIRTSLSVDWMAERASRTSGWLVQSPVRARGRRSARRYSSSEWKAPRRGVFFQVAATASAFRTKQGAGRGAHEHLDAAAAGQALELAEPGGVLVRAADVEGVVAVHAAAGAAQ